MLVCASERLKARKSVTTRSLNVHGVEEGNAIDREGKAAFRVAHFPYHDKTT